MSAESSLYAILTADAGVIALVGDRIYPDLIPEGKVAPYIGYERVATDPIATIHGTILGTDVGFVVACWADTRLQAEQVADAVATAMQAAGHVYTGRGAELDEATGRLAATLDYILLT
ncbi:MAG: DUF3168 domain-containing protein [Aeromonas veronii]